MANDLLVFGEIRDGELKRASLEALGAARRIADADGARVDAVVLGSAAAAGVEALGGHGADRVFVCEEAWLDHYQAEAYAACLAAAAGEGGVSRILVPGTILGRDLAARAAARLGCGLASDLVEVGGADGGGLRGKRPLYSGKAFATVRVDGSPAMATLRPNVFAPQQAAKAGERVALACPIAEGDLKVRTVRVERAEQREQDVAEAGVIVSGGRGLKEADNFALVRELAEALGGAVGASRAVVDDNWIGHAHQVGQTGKVVSPNLYVAVGISGAIQHLAGMSTSKVIVAINKDAEAPIFKVADYGIVGDLFEVLPELTKAVKAVKALG